MSDKSQNNVRIAIDNVQIGMFVTAIERNTRVNLTTAGVVSSKTAIKQLVDSGVKFVWVDVRNSAAACQFIVAPDKVAEEDVPEAEQPKLKPVKASDPALNKKRAKKLVTEARELANKIILDTFEGNPIDAGELDKWADDVIDAVMDNSDALKFVSALRSKDTYLLEHSVNVACLLVTFGTFLKFDKEVLKALAIGGMVHDLGKTKIRDDVLNKPGRLTKDEFEHIKKHQVYVSDLLKGISGLSKISKIVCLMHHEKLNGSGYPRGLKAEQIPVYGRMSAIVDIYDALTAERCYKQGMSPQEAFKILLGMAPEQLDQDLVYKFINCLGVNPAGSLVLLSDGSVGLVEEVSSAGPVIKCFYSLKYKKYTIVKTIKLSSSGLSIERAIAPSSLNIDISPFYD